MFIVTFLFLHVSSHLSLRNLNDDPVLLLKFGNCKIQTGTLKIVHPINLTTIRNSIDFLTSSFYNKLDSINPLGEIVKHKIKILYNNFIQISPVERHRSKRWDQIGATWKWLAGSPDAQDLRIINSTLNELISQNNEQFDINNRINKRISELTNSINKIIVSMKTNDLANEISAIITIINVDIINKLLEDIQDAIILSKTSITANRVLSIQEISFIKSLLQDQGVKVDLPDEALQHVTPKFAVNQQTLLYILHVPRLENETSSVVQVHPLVHKNQIIYSYPEYIIKKDETLYVTSQPNEFVQKAAYLTEIHDTCIYPLIFGKESVCNSTHTNRTTQLLITDNALLIQNANNNTIRSNCGPDDRSLVGNFLVTFSNCLITFNNESFENSEIIQETNIIYGALHNIKMNWNHHQNLDISIINNQTLGNRKKLEKVHLEHHNLKFKFHTLLGGLSFSYIILVFVVFMTVKRFCKLQFNGTGRSSLQGGVVTDRSFQTPELSTITDHIEHQLQELQQQQNDIAHELQHLQSS